jgi:hypothetical protein
MELPKWAYHAESRARADGIDIVFSLRPLGRLWLYWRAIVDLVRTSTITVSIGFQKNAVVVTHDGEVIETPRAGQGTKVTR